jgi:glyoxalase-like protein
VALHKKDGNDSAREVNDSEHVIKGIDHLIVMATDLDRSNRLWRLLGFVTTPRGVHDSGGTANHLIMLDQTYIELLGMGVRGEASPYRHMMEEAPGLWGIALRGSAEAAFRLWSSLGLEVAAPASLSRAVDIAGRRERARFQITMLARTAEVPFVIFCCEQLTPQFVWQPDRALHPNGALTIREVVLIVQDDAAQRQFERIMGRSASIDSRGSVTIRLGECQIVFLSEAHFVQRFGAAAAFRSSAHPTIAAVTIASADLEGARSEARHAGVPVLPTRRGGFIETLRDEGVVVEWVAASSS